MAQWLTNAFKLDRSAFVLAAVAILSSACAANGAHPGLPAAAPASAQPVASQVGSPVPAAKGTSDSGGEDWFVKPLPILKIAFPKDGEVVEGVRYKSIHLRPCTAEESHPTYPQYEPTIYFPGKNFSAVKVQASFNNLVCSYGVVETDPDRALQILVNNDDTNRTEVFDGVTMRSKSFGGPLAVGNYLLTVLNAKKANIFGQTGMLNIELDQHFWANPAQPGDENSDLIYVPSEILPSKKVYFGNNPDGNWRLVLPLAYAPADLPLQDFSNALTAAYLKKDPVVLDLLNKVAMPEGFPNGSGAPEWKVAQIWSTLERTCDNRALLDRFYTEYSLPLHTGGDHFYTELKVLYDKFTFKFSPTVSVEEINQASYHDVSSRTVFALPLLNPSWRVAADMLHETTHAVQNHAAPNTDETHFKNEMEAHLTERAYLKSLGEKYDVVRLSISTYGAVAASGLPKVRLVNALVKPDATPLCEDVLNSYGLDRAKIAPDTLRTYGCGNN